MAEILFILVTVYVVYVVHSVVSGDYKNKVKPIITPKAEVIKVKTAVKEEPKKPVTVKKTTVKKAVAKKTVTKKAPAVRAKAKSASGNLRNPETQEVVKVANSYRMTKRWIKEALVTEGLLDKVYKTNELDDAAKAKISKALLKLEKIEKYQA